MQDLKSMKAQGSPPDLGGQSSSRTGPNGGSNRRTSLSPLSPTSPTSPTSPLSPSSAWPSMEQSRSYISSVDGQDGARPKQRRRSASFADSETGSIPASPPYISDDDEEDFQSFNTSSEGLGGWHYAPLIIALAPPIGAVIGGKADVFSDVILVVIASFWLYQFLRVPWEIYYSARTRRILSHDAGKASRTDEDGDTSTETAGAERKKSEEQLLKEIDKERARTAAMAELQRSEIMALLLCVLSPLIGAYLLSWMRETMSDGGRYINSFNLRLFTLTAGIKPWSHAVKLVRRRMLHLQEEVHYPSSKVEDLSKSVKRMQAELSSIRTMIATKNDIRILRDVDAQLGRAFRRTERKEEHLRLSAEDKFNEVENRLEDLLREVAINAELIEEERRERERAASLRISLFEAIKYLLGSGLTIRRGGHKHYLHDAPRTLPSAASLGVGSGSPTNEQPSPYYPVQNGARHPSAPQLQQGQPTPASPGARPPYVSGAPLPPLSNGNKPTSGTSSPPLDSHMISRYYERNGVSQVSPDPWWERGLAFYLFLPLNVSNAAFRFASDKIRSMVEDDPDDPALKKQRKFQHQIISEAQPKRSHPKLVKQVGRRGRSE